MSYTITDQGTYTEVILDRSPEAENIYWAYPKTVRIEVVNTVLFIYYNNIIQKIPKAFITFPTSTSDEDLLDQLAYMVEGGGGSAVDTNLAITDLTADANRIFTGAGFDLTFTDIDTATWNIGTSNRSVTGGENISIGGSQTLNITTNQEITIGGNQSEVITGDYTRTIGGDSSKVVISKVTPPSNTSYLWLNSSSNELYKYDGVHWVSEKKTPLIWSDNGSTSNNTFLKIGDVRTTTTRGAAFNQDVKILSLGYTNTTGVSKNLNIYVNGVLSQTVAIPFVGGGRGFVNLATPIVLAANNQIAIQYNGTSTNDIIVEMYYKYIGA